MDIANESFPDVGLIPSDASKELRPNSGNSSSDDHNSSFSPRTLQEGDSSAQSSSGCSNQGRNFKPIDASGLRSAKSTKTKFPPKAQSYQDLHSEYTKKRYQHVKSKVKQYIVNIQNEGRRRQTITRHRSLPETLSHHSDRPNSRSRDENDNCKECNHEEMVQLKTLNDYLQENLQEKMTQMAKLKRNSDAMRIELMQLKEKERQKKGSSLFKHPGRHILPSFPYETRERITTGTQTLEIISASPEPKPIPAKEESEGVPNEAKKKRLRFQLNRSMHTESASIGNDLAIDSEFEDEDQYEKSAREQSAFLGPKSKKRRKCKVFKGKNWKFMFGSCSGVVPCCDRKNSLRDEFVYTQVPLNEIYVL